MSITEIPSIRELKEALIADGFEEFDLKLLEKRNQYPPPVAVNRVHCIAKSWYASNRRFDLASKMGERFLLMTKEASLFDVAVEWRWDKSDGHVVLLCRRDANMNALLINTTSTSLGAIALPFAISKSAWFNDKNLFNQFYGAMIELIKDMKCLETDLLSLSSAAMSHLIECKSSGDGEKVKWSESQVNIMKGGGV